MKFGNRVVVITGAASGIGRACALAFLENGGNVVAVDIAQDGLETLSKEIRKKFSQALVPIHGDIKDPTTATRATDAALKHFGRLDFLVNNAGTELISPLLDTDENAWDHVIDTNVRGSYLMARACLKIMVENKFGVIVNNASDAGMRCVRMTAAYSTSKAAIVQLSNSIALDYGSKGIRSNCICPGCIRTPLCERFNHEVGLVKGKSGKEVLQEFVNANIPMLRVGEPEEVASVVLFLCGDDARYINGATIPIDGGLSAGINV